MGKNIVLCLDGTGNQLKATGNTNVIELYEMLDLSDPAKQVAYYDPGVGTFSAGGTWTPIGRAMSKLTGLAFGAGLRTNLGEAYTYLMHTYQPGDQIYLFGFSRGAYTARALAGIVKTVGLLRPGAENLVHYAVSSYAKKKLDWDELHRFAEAFSEQVDGRFGIPIHFMGVWDTVKAAGILRWNLKWPYTRTAANVTTIRHAVSIDEKRRPYREYLLEPDQDRPKAWLQQEIHEAWFSGVHSDIGGGFKDDPRLAEIARKWIVDGAHGAGILLKPRAYEKKTRLTASHARGKIHRMGRIWALLTYRRRRIPEAAAVHSSVRNRAQSDKKFAKRLPKDVTWVDEQWLEPWSPGSDDPPQQAEAS